MGCNCGKKNKRTEPPRTNEAARKVSGEPTPAVMPAPKTTQEGTSNG